MKLVENRFAKCVGLVFPSVIPHISTICHSPSGIACEDKEPGDQKDDSPPASIERGPKMMFQLLIAPDPFEGFNALSKGFSLSGDVWAYTCFVHNLEWHVHNGISNIFQYFSFHTLGLSWKNYSIEYIDHTTTMHLNSFSCYIFLAYLL